MSKRGKNKGKGKPQQATPVTAAPAEEAVLEAQLPAAIEAVPDSEAAPAEAAEAVVEVVAETASAKPARPQRQTPKPRPRDRRSPFLVLADYEQRSLAHVAGLPEQLDAPGLWRGVAYRVGSHRLASGFDEVVEILSMPTLTAVPGSQAWMLGVANVRGTLLPVVDLKQFLEGERTVLHEGQRVLVVRQSGGNVAVTIDELYGQRTFNDSHRAEAPDANDGRYGHFVGQAYRLADQTWGVFNMSLLTRTPEFRQATV